MRTHQSDVVRLKGTGDAVTFVIPRGHSVASLAFSINADIGAAGWGNGVLEPKVSPDGIRWFTPVDWCGVPVGPVSSTYLDAKSQYIARMIRVEDVHFFRVRVTTSGSTDTYIRVSCITSDKPPPRQPSRVVRLLADVANGTTGWADITGLTAYLVAGRRYRIEARLVYQSANTGEGLMFNFNGPSATEFVSRVMVSTSDTGADVVRQARAYDTSTTTTGLTPANSDFYAIANAYVQPSASGYFTARFRAEAGTANITVKAGSTMEVRPL